MVINNFLKGRNISLRSLVESDITQKYVDFMADPNVNAFMESRHTVWSISLITQYINDINESDDSFIFGIFKDDNHIGNIKCGPIDPIHSFSYLSLFIGDKRHWGKGYASEAILLMTSLCFDNLNLHKLCAGMYSDNVGSLKAFLKAGFMLEGIFKEQYLLTKDSRTDYIQVGLSKNQHLMRLK